MEDTILPSALDNTEAKSHWQLGSTGDKDSESWALNISRLRKEVDDEFNVFVSFTFVQGINDDNEWCSISKEVGASGESVENEGLELYLRSLSDNGRVGIEPLFDLRAQGWLAEGQLACYRSEELGQVASICLTPLEEEVGSEQTMASK